KDIPYGTLLNEPKEWFKVKPQLKESAPKNYIDNMEVLKGKRVNKPIRSESFVSQSDLGDKVGLEVTKGMRAMAVQVTQEKSVGGCVRRGWRVDVLLTSRDSGGAPKAEPILQNLRVLAVDTVSRPEPGKESYVPTTVTLEVSPDDALKLSSAKDRGRIE